MIRIIRVRIIVMQIMQNSQNPQILRHLKNRATYPVRLLKCPATKGFTSGRCWGKNITYSYSS